MHGCTLHSLESTVHPCMSVGPISTHYGRFEASPRSLSSLNTTLLSSILSSILAEVFRDSSGHLQVKIKFCWIEKSKCRIFGNSFKFLQSAGYEWTPFDSNHSAAVGKPRESSLHILILYLHTTTHLLKTQFKLGK